jgi:anti-sigma-K factor RskA
MSHPRDLLNDYVLGTLTPSEKAQVEAYLATSAEARAEERILRESLVAFTDSLNEVPVPRSAWAKIQAGLEQDRVIQNKVVEASSKIICDQPRKSKGWTSERAAWLTAACFAIIGFMAGWWGVNRYQAYQQTRVDKELVTAYLSNTNAQRINLIGENFTDLGSVLVSGDRALFVLANAPARGQTYQTWGHTNGEWEPGSTEQLTSLQVSDDNIFEINTGQFAALYLSLEPSGGSPQPTQPLARVSLRNPIATSPLEIARPENGTTVNSSSIIVSGIVDNTVTALSYSLNGGESIETTFGSNSFTFTVMLAEGENTITVEARRADGEIVQETISVVRSE